MKMKKALFFLPGTLVVMLAASPLISSFTYAAVAAPVPTHAHKHGWMQQLNLSDAQKAQIKQIRQAAKQKRDAIFTPEQKAQRQQARLQHQKVKLNLSADQKAQLKAIWQDTESQIKAVLTPQQQQQLEQLRSQRRQNHQQHQS